MRGRLVGVTAIGVAAAAYMLVGRPAHLSWSATDQESAEPLPGDHLIENADLSATRAITIRASADQVWPWIAQLGQGRGGFYSYDFLENLVGCDIHSANRFVPEWQDVRVGDEVKFSPEVGLVVALLEPGRSLVLRGGVPLGNTAPPYDFTWAFTLRDDPDETTRLLVRERYAYKRPWARFLIEPVEAVSFVMSQKMLRGIRDRAERAAALPLAVGPVVNYCDARVLFSSGLVISLRFIFHSGEAGVVVGKLLKMGERDLACHDGIAVGDVG